MKLITCEFNMDSGCVELRFDDGTALDIDCTAIENKYAKLFPAIAHATIAFLITERLRGTAI